MNELNSFERVHRCVMALYKTSLKNESNPYLHLSLVNIRARIKIIVCLEEIYNCHKNCGQEKALQLLYKRTIFDKDFDYVIFKLRQSCILLVRSSCYLFCYINRNIDINGFALSSNMGTTIKDFNDNVIGIMNENAKGVIFNITALIFHCGIKTIIADSSVN